jgi:hypothetical protein
MESVFNSEMITNLWLVGFIEGKLPRKEFHPMLWWIYFQFETCYLRCESVNQWHAKLQIVESIALDFEVDPDDEFAVMPAAGLFLSEPKTKGQKIVRFECLLDESSNLENGLVKCGGFVLSNSDTLFFDPSNSLGFRLGTADQVKSWTSRLHTDVGTYRTASIITR